jgi:hypothetical protein
LKEKTKKKKGKPKKEEVPKEEEEIMSGEKGMKEGGTEKQEVRER